MKLVHVLPINDLAAHKEVGEDCWCEPKVEEGVVVHNSADGREFKEEGKDFITGIV